jgi:hypothetical protein
MLYLKYFILISLSFCLSSCKNVNILSEPDDSINEPRYGQTGFYERPRCGVISFEMPAPRYVRRAPPCEVDSYSYCQEDFMPRMNYFSVEPSCYEPSFEIVNVDEMIYRYNKAAREYCVDFSFDDLSYVYEMKRQRMLELNRRRLRRCPREFRNRRILIERDVYNQSYRDADLLDCVIQR